MYENITSAMKTVLRYVGNFVELGYDHHPDPPSLVALRGKRGPAEKQTLVGYLRAGVAFIVSPGSDDDVLDPSKRAGSATIRTDGVYAWPNTLAYYVDTYDVALPAEFEAHARANGWRVPAVDKLSLELPKFP